MYTNNVTLYYILYESFSGFVNHYMGLHIGGKIHQD